MSISRKSNYMLCVGGWMDCQKIVPLWAECGNNEQATSGRSTGHQPVWKSKGPSVARPIFEMLLNPSLGEARWNNNKT